MNVIYLSVFLLCCVLVKGENYLESALKSVKWNDEDQPCLERIYKTIQDARNNTLYAVWMLDAMQMIPIGQLYGARLHTTNYDECLDRHWRTTHPELNTQYCHANIKLSEAKEWKGYVPDPKGPSDLYLKTLTPEGIDLTLMDWGLCLPDVCSNSTATKIFRALLQSSHLGPIADNAKITVLDCEIAGENKRNDNAVTVLRYITVTLLVIAVFCTYYTMNYKLNPKSYAHEIIRSFCLKRNYETITNTYDEEIYVLNIMRIYPCVTLAIGHFVALLLTNMHVGGLIVDKQTAENGTLLRQGNMVVDIFFAISGMLIVRGYLVGNWSNPIKFLIKRYIRIFGLIILVAYVKSYVLYDLGDGPLWEQLMGNEKRICQENIWTTIATLQNYVSTVNMCYVTSWSASVDYHMSVFAVFICVIYGKNRRLGTLIFIIAFVVALVLQGYIIYARKLPLSLCITLEACRVLRNNILFQTVYRYTHTRASSFLVGMVMGYILATYKPAEYRNRISRKASYIYLIASVAVMHTIIYLGGEYFYRNPEAEGVFVFGYLNRALFAAAACVIVAVTEYGNLGILHEFIKISPFVVLSRLTSGVYVLHYIIVERVVYVTRTDHTTDYFNYFVFGMGIAVISFALCFVVSLLVEGPLINIVNILLDGPRGNRRKGKAILDAKVANGLIENLTSTNTSEYKQKKDE